MTANYRATPEQWEWISGIPTAAEACILELRARVEALEAAQQPATCPHIVSSDEGTSYCRLAEQGAAPRVRYRYSLVTIAECGGPCKQGPEHCDCGEIKPEPAPAPTGSLVERLAKAIADSDDPHQLWYDDARAAILTAATWLRERGHASAASALEREADR